MKKFFILIVVSAFAFNAVPFAFAQTNVPRARAEALLSSLTPGTVESAIDAFAKNSLIPDELVDSVASQARTVITPERTVLGFELLQEQHAGQSVKRLTYVLKLSNGPLFWNFSFYKPTNDWVPLRISFVEEP